MIKRLNLKECMKILHKKLDIDNEPNYIEKSKVYEDLHYHIKDSDFRLVIRVSKRTNMVINITLYYGLKHIVDMPSYDFELKFICKIIKIIRSDK